MGALGFPPSFTIFLTGPVIMIITIIVIILVITIILVIMIIMLFIPLASVIKQFQVRMHSDLQNPAHHPHPRQQQNHHYKF